MWGISKKKQNPNVWFRPREEKRLRLVREQRWFFLLVGFVGATIPRKREFDGEAERGVGYGNRQFKAQRCRSNQPQILNQRFVFLNSRKD
jgi:hypothetical protein